ncbi:MAG: cyclic-di-AMP receptor [Chloroflexi bacterium]|nr:cyclic-di-AMP receptor [Chloroflexota bacterium]
MSSSRLTVAIIQPEDANGLLTALAAVGCGATYLTARGGFLNRHAVAVLVLADISRETAVIQAIRSTCSTRTVLVTPVAEAEFGYVPEPIEVEIGGAVMFGLAASSTSWGNAAAPPGRPGGGVMGSTTVPGAIVTPLESTREGPLMLDTSPAKLIVAIVPDRVAGKVVAALVERRFGATSVGSTGGFLRRGNTTILTGVPADQANQATALIEATCRAAPEVEPREGGVVFALDVDWRLRV